MQLCQAPIFPDKKQADRKEATVGVFRHDKPSPKLGVDIDFCSRASHDEDMAERPDAIAAAHGHINQIIGKAVTHDHVHVNVLGTHCEDLTLIDPLV